MPECAKRVAAFLPVALSCVIGLPGSATADCPTCRPCDPLPSRSDLIWAIPENTDGLPTDPRFLVRQTDVDGEDVDWRLMQMPSGVLVDFDLEPAGVLGELSDFWWLQPAAPLDAFETYRLEARYGSGTSVTQLGLTFTTGDAPRTNGPLGIDYFHLEPRDEPVPEFDRLCTDDAVASITLDVTLGASDASRFGSALWRWTDPETDEERRSLLAARQTEAEDVDWELLLVASRHRGEERTAARCFGEAWMAYQFLHVDGVLEIYDRVGQLMLDVELDFDLLRNRPDPTRFSDCDAEPGAASTGDLEQQGVDLPPHGDGFYDQGGDTPTDRTVDGGLASADDDAADRRSSGSRLFGCGVAARNVGGAWSFLVAWLWLRVRRQVTRRQG